MAEAMIDKSSLVAFRQHMRSVDSEREEENESAWRRVPREGAAGERGTQEVVGAGSQGRGRRDLLLHKRVCRRMRVATQGDEHA